MIDPKSFNFYATAFLAALLLFTMLQAARAQPPVVPTQHKHCVCVSHGPRGGCLRWSCRRQYERARPQ